MTPAEQTALDRFAAASRDRARRLRLLAEADDALAAHLLRCPEEGDAAGLLAWLVHAATTTMSEAQDAWDRAFAEGA